MKRILVFIAVIALAGCVAFKSPSVPDEDFQAAAAALKEKKYPEAVSAYKKILAESPQSERSADALFQLAYIQTLYDNPQRDYIKALQSFDEFIKRYSQHEKIQDAENWHAVLRTVLDLKKENDRLHKNIEQLKKLDIRHEEKRIGK